MAVSGPSDQWRFGFSNGNYRIRSIRLIDASGRVQTLFSEGSAAFGDPAALKYGECFRLQVDYECLMKQLPRASCGVAAAFTRLADMQHVMYFNTNYPHSDEELRTYYEQEFRRYIGRRGTVEAYIPVLQTRPDKYLLTVGILPNEPAPHDFYEVHFLRYHLTVESNKGEFPAAFYPKVTFRYHLLTSDSK